MINVWSAYTRCTASSSGSHATWTVKHHVVHVWWCSSTLHEHGKRTAGYNPQFLRNGSRSPDLYLCNFCISKSQTAWRPRSTLKPSTKQKNFGSRFKMYVQQFKQSLHFWEHRVVLNPLCSIVCTDTLRPSSTFLQNYDFQIFVFNMKLIKLLTALLPGMYYTLSVSLKHACARICTDTHTHNLSFLPLPLSSFSSPVCEHNFRWKFQLYI